MHSDHPAHLPIVDDTPTNLEALLKILDRDYDVSIATSGHWTSCGRARCRT